MMESMFSNVAGKCQLHQGRFLEFSEQVISRATVNDRR